MEAMDGKIIETILRHPRRRSFRHTFLALSRHDIDAVAAHSKAPCEFQRQYLGSCAVPGEKDMGAQENLHRGFRTWLPMIFLIAAPSCRRMRYMIE